MAAVERCLTQPQTTFCQNVVFNVRVRGGDEVEKKKTPPPPNEKRPKKNIGLVIDYEPLIVVWFDGTIIVHYNYSI